MTVDIKTYRVKRKESIKSIASKFNLSEELLKKFNNEIYTRELIKGERINIPVIKKVKINKDTSLSKLFSKDNLFIHTVLPRETKYGIAGRYEITIAELELLNPNMGENLKVGDEIKVPKNIIFSESTVTEEDDYELYEVLPKEGFFRLKIKFGLDPDEIILLNPQAANGLKEGMILKIPKLLNSENEDKKQTIDLSNYIVNTKKKKLALMLPLNLNRIDLDSLVANIALLRKDGTLGVAIDFYSGVLMAAEFMKDKGVSTEINIYDTEGNTAKVEQIISNHNFNDVDVVIWSLIE